MHWRILKLTKIISKETYYHAMALYMLCRMKQSEVDKTERELHAVLGLEVYSTHFSDFIYMSENAGTKEEFDEAMLREDIEVEGTKEGNG